LEVWGCLAKVAVSNPNDSENYPKILDYIFVEYAHNSNAYRFLVYKSKIIDIRVNTIMEFKNETFLGNISPNKTTKESNSSKQVRIENDNEIISGNVKEETRRIKKARNTKSYRDDFLVFC
jgi:heme-binding NEAT domain protein